MAYFPASVGGGVQKASSYTDAYQKAKSYIIAILTFTTSNSEFNCDILIPKEEIKTTTRNFFNGAYYTNSMSFYVVVQVTTTTLSNATAYVNGSAVSTNVVFYYD